MRQTNVNRNAPVRVFTLNDDVAYVHINDRGYTIMCGRKALVLFTRLTEHYIPNQFTFTSIIAEDEFIEFVKNNCDESVDILANYGLKENHDGSSITCG